MLNWFKKSDKKQGCCSVQIEEVKEERASCCNVKIEEVDEEKDNLNLKVKTTSNRCSSKEE